MIGSSAGHQTARRTDPLQLAAEGPDTVVNVRFAVRHDDDTNAAEALSEERHKAIARPLRLPGWLLRTAAIVRSRV
jgi:hypothetical protein